MSTGENKSFISKNIFSNIQTNNSLLNKDDFSKKTSKAFSTSNNGDSTSTVNSYPSSSNIFKPIPIQNIQKIESNNNFNDKNLIDNFKPVNILYYGINNDNNNNKNNNNNNNNNKNNKNNKNNDDNNNENINENKNNNNLIKNNSLNSNIFYPKFDPLKCLSLDSNPQSNSFFFKEKTCCTCTKTRCIKKYCECFANGKFCFGCHCIDCFNQPSFNKDFKNFNNNINNKTNSSINSENFSETEIVVCTCSKSNCNKKYCECYKNNKKCSEKCRCLNCLNGMENKNNIFDDENNEEFMKENKMNPVDFCIQHTSVYINKNQTVINVEKMGKEDMLLLNKKTSRENFN